MQYLLLDHFHKGRVGAAQTSRKVKNTSAKCFAVLDEWWLTCGLFVSTSMASLD